MARYFSGIIYMVFLLCIAAGCKKPEKLLPEASPGETSNEAAGVKTEEADNAAAVPPIKEGPLKEPNIIVLKSERRLELYDEDLLVGAYPVALGREPFGDKKAEGDGRTPEGNYFICTRNEQSRFYLSLGISYPNKEDAKEALDSGTIDRETYDLISAAADNLSKPPWDTPLGGEIMIHGIGSHEDWTEGCVAVNNNVMDVLWQYCPLGTPVIIKP
jgi:hypothetical protein